MNPIKSKKNISYLKCIRIEKSFLIHFNPISFTGKEMFCVHCNVRDVHQVWRHYPLKLNYLILLTLPCYTFITLKSVISLLALLFCTLTIVLSFDCFIIERLSKEERLQWEITVYISVIIIYIYIFIDVHLSLNILDISKSLIIDLTHQEFADLHRYFTFYLINSIDIIWDLHNGCWKNSRYFEKNCLVWIIY